MDYSWCLKQRLVAASFVASIGSRAEDPNFFWLIGMLANASTEVVNAECDENLSFYLSPLQIETFNEIVSRYSSLDIEIVLN